MAADELVSPAGAVARGERPRHAPRTGPRRKLHHAREIRLADERAHAARRRAEKAFGRCRPPADGSGRRPQRRWGNIAHCPDPAFSPTEPLPVVVRAGAPRLGRPGEAGVSTCRVCGQRGDTVLRADGSLWERVLSRCGAGLARRRVPRDVGPEAERGTRWKEIRASRTGHRRSDGPPCP
ncbi:hypothetical protein [Streptomyces sp. NPDC006527]|uniref:hypothetical protein n=1 Tax=Streptomyces sp. NPDC006527 TaxID=3364749 RepID=UPI0036AA971A